VPFRTRVNCRTAACTVRTQRPEGRRGSNNQEPHEARHRHPHRNALPVPAARANAEPVIEAALYGQKITDLRSLRRAKNQGLHLVREEGHQSARPDGSVPRSAGARRRLREPLDLRQARRQRRVSAARFAMTSRCRPFSSAAECLRIAAGRWSSPVARLQCAGADGDCRRDARADGTTTPAPVATETASPAPVETETPAPWRPKPRPRPAATEPRRPGGRHRDASDRHRSPGCHDDARARSHGDRDA
jgi:hypothetical protein